MPQGNTLYRHFTASVQSPHQAAESRHAVRRLRSFPARNLCVPNNQYLNNSRTKESEESCRLAILQKTGRSEREVIHCTKIPRRYHVSRKLLHVHVMDVL